MEQCEALYHNINLEKLLSRGLRVIIAILFLYFISVKACGLAGNFSIQNVESNRENVGEIAKERVLLRPEAEKENASDILLGIDDMINPAGKIAEGFRKIELEYLLTDMPRVPEAVPDYGAEEVSENTVPDSLHTSVVEVPLPESSTQEETTGGLISVNGFLVDEDGMICGIEPGPNVLYDGYLLNLPEENCIGIRSGAFTNAPAGIMEMYIPENITDIETGAFKELNELEWIDVSPGNVNYSSPDGALFTSDLSCVLAFPSARTETYILPGTVTKLGDYAFYNTRLNRIDMRMCGAVEIGESVFGESNGAGITIDIPDGMSEYYQNAFSGYGVTLAGPF